MFSKVLSLPSPTLLLRYYFHPQLLKETVVSHQSKMESPRSTV